RRRNPGVGRVSSRLRSPSVCAGASSARLVGGAAAGRGRVPRAPPPGRAAASPQSAVQSSCGTARGGKGRMAIKIEIELGDEDVERFRAMFGQARRVADSMDRKEILNATRSLVAAAADNNPRGFIRERIEGLG